MWPDINKNDVKKLLIILERLIENLAYSLNRIVIGALICIILAFSYFYNLDPQLIILILLTSFYDLYKSKIINKLFIFYIFLIFLIVFCYYFLNLDLILFLIIIEVLLILVSLYYSYLVKLIFPFLILIFIYSMFYLLQLDRNLFYLCFIFSFINDTSAYIFGKFLKGPLIWPSISQKNLVWYLFINLIIFFSITFIGFNIYLSFLIAISFFIGDVYFSYIKRNLSIKDFSNLLGSHGGTLDRLDSIFLMIIILIIFNSSL